MVDETSAKLCQFCESLSVSKLKQDLFDHSDKRHNAIVLHTMSHAEFDGCASVRDICSKTALRFKEEVNIWGERIGDATIEVPAARNDSHFQLLLTDKSNWHVVYWMIEEQGCKLQTSYIKSSFGERLADHFNSQST